jgi:UDP-GlcNAc:undecaprenyl-phosphate GlcNAc-1-phosphate transferase
MGFAATTLAAALGAATARLSLGVVGRNPPGPDPKIWNRVNHRGEPVTLLEGPAYAIGAATAVAILPALPGPLRAAAVGATLGAGAFGVHDDLRGDADRRGMRGHLAALAQGELTTGGVKIMGIGAVGLLAGAIVRRGPADTLVDKLLAGVVIAGAANAVNLLDLRPGRAVKAATIAAAPGVLRATMSGNPAARASAAGLGAALAMLPEDLGERAMLGDAGANALGALLGTVAAATADRRGLALRAAALVGVTMASERVSFTRVIAKYAPLRALDGIGRRA